MSFVPFVVTIPGMNNIQISATFDTLADLLEFKGENPFRVRAYRTAGRIIHDLSEPVADILKDPERKLTDLAGIGKDLADKIATLVTTGELPMLVELQREVPASVLTLLRIPGLGPKKAAALYKELKITTLDELRAACEAHQIRQLKGFAAKTEEAILAGIGLAATAHVRMYWAEADQFAQNLLTWLQSVPAVVQAEVAGSYRRGKETIGDLDILVESADAEAVMDRFAAYPEIEATLGRGDTKQSVRLHGGLQVDVRVVPGESFGAALQYFTGSKEHNVVLRGMAKSRGLKINEYGVFRVSDKGEKQIAGRTEQDVYATLDLPWFPPELREARHEFEWAAAGKLPNLIELDDLQGDLHMHTNATDGKATLDEMIAAARARGLKYIAITDHSQRVSMANGLNPARARAQWAEIDQRNEHLRGFRVLKGIEVDILEDGRLDLPDDVLAEADWVVASVHYGQNQPRDKITQRIVGALANPHVSAIAHPTGRLINRRKPYDVDLGAVYRAARQYGKLLELNSNPARLDLDDLACAAAKEQGIPIVISTDAHSTDGLSVMRYGVLQARRAGLTKADVANTRPWKQMQGMIGKEE